MSVSSPGGRRVSLSPPAPDTLFSRMEEFKAEVKAEMVHQRVACEEDILQIFEAHEALRQEVEALQVGPPLGLVTPPPPPGTSDTRPDLQGYITSCVRKAVADALRATSASPSGGAKRRRGGRSGRSASPDCKALPSFAVPCVRGRGGAAVVETRHISPSPPRAEDAAEVLEKMEFRVSECMASVDHVGRNFETLEAAVRADQAKVVDACLDSARRVGVLEAELRRVKAEPAPQIRGDAARLSEAESRISDMTTHVATLTSQMRAVRRDQHIAATAASSSSTPSTPAGATAAAAASTSLPPFASPAASGSATPIGAERGLRGMADATPDSLASCLAGVVFGDGVSEHQMRSDTAQLCRAAGCGRSLVGALLGIAERVAHIDAEVASSKELYLQNYSDVQSDYVCLLSIVEALKQGLAGPQPARRRRGSASSNASSGYAAASRTSAKAHHAHPLQSLVTHTAMADLQPEIQLLARRLEGVEAQQQHQQQQQRAAQDASEEVAHLSRDVAEAAGELRALSAAVAEDRRASRVFASETRGEICEINTNMVTIEREIEVMQEAGLRPPSLPRGEATPPPPLPLPPAEAAPLTPPPVSPPQGKTMEALQRTVDSLAGQIDSIQIELLPLQRFAPEDAAELERHKAQLAFLAKGFSVLESEVEVLQQKDLSLGGERSAAAAAASGNAAEIAGIRAAVERLEKPSGIRHQVDAALGESSRIRNIEEALQACERAAASAAGEREDISQSCASLRKRLGEIEGDVATLQQDSESPLGISRDVSAERADEGGGGVDGARLDSLEAEVARVVGEMRSRGDSEEQAARLLRVEGEVRPLRQGAEDQRDAMRGLQQQVELQASRCEVFASELEGLQATLAGPGGMRESVAGILQREQEVRGKAENEKKRRGSDSTSSSGSEDARGAATANAVSALRGDLQNLRQRYDILESLVESTRNDEGILDQLSVLKATVGKLQEAQKEVSRGVTQEEWQMEAKSIFDELMNLGALFEEESRKTSISIKTMQSNLECVADDVRDLETAEQRRSVGERRASWQKPASGVSPEDLAKIQGEVTGMKDLIDDMFSVVEDVHRLETDLGGIGDVTAALRSEVEALSEKVQGRMRDIPRGPQREGSIRSRSGSAFSPINPASSTPPPSDGGM